MLVEYAPQSRAERLIAAGRVVLAVFSLLAVWLDPSSETTSGYARLLDALVPLYFLYALLLAVVEWSRHAPLYRLRFLTHAFDLTVFVLFSFFTEGPASPFVVFFVFSLVCGTLRWQSRGTVWTAAAALAAFIGMGVYAIEVERRPTLALNGVVVRGMYLVVVATLLAYMGEYEERVRKEMSRLAAWPRVVPGEAQALAREVLQHVAGVLGAPRLLLCWDEPEEPWRYLAWLSAGRFQVTREAPDVFEPLVAEPLAESSFLCPESPAGASVLHTAPEGLRRWHGSPFHPDLVPRLGESGLLSLALRGDSVEGRLFALDKPGMTSDDLVLGEIVARQVAARMDHFYLSQRLQQAAASEERIQLARDLHDGVVQSLTATALQVELARNLIAGAPEAARERLLEVQRLLAAEQHDLRIFIGQLKPTLPGMSEPGFDLAARLDDLRGRMERQWGLEVKLQAAPLQSRVPDGVAQQIYRIVHEALVNVARHAGATAVRVELGLEGGGVRIAVADNGRGFAFRGRYDLAGLTEQSLGPVVLRERVASLGGSLVVDSTDEGVRLEIALPTTWTS